MLADIMCVDKLNNHIVYEDIIDLDVNTLVEGFAACRKLYGRCTSEVHIDKGGKTYHIGYVFESRHTENNRVYQYWVTFYRSKQTVYNYLTD